MRVKCDSIGLMSEEYSSKHIVKNIGKIYTGFKIHLVDEQIIDQFYAGEKILIEKEDARLSPNQFVMLVSNSNEKKTALAKFINYLTPLRRVNGDFNDNGLWGVKPRNKEQSFAADLLMDPKISVVSLIGKAGSGKTLLALAAGLAQVV